jgi:ABC-2 type transport system permease protein
MLLVRRTRAVFAYRRVLWLLTLRELKVRYAGSFLGYLWTVLEPLMMVGVYWFVFTKVFTRGTKSEDPYILFLVGGLLAWNWFQGAVNDTAMAMSGDSRLVRSTNIPREIWVLKAVAAKGLEFIFSLPVIVLFMVLYHKRPNHYIVLWPVAIVAEFMLLTGIGLALSAVCVLVKDVRRVIRIVLRVGFYLTPVVYGITRIPKTNHLRDILALNPMAGIIEMFRVCLFPKQLVSWWVLVSAVVISFVVMVIGLLVFNRLERAVLKEI